MRLFSVIKELKTRITDDGVFDLAAQLAYYFLLSLFPFLMLAVTLLGFLPVSSQNILEMIRPYAPPTTYELIKTNLSVIMGEQRNSVLSISAVVTVYLASVGFQSIIRILDDAYLVKEDRPFWKEVVLGFFLMFGLLFGLVISLVLPVFGKIIGIHFFQVFGLTHWFYQIWNWARWLLSTLVLFSVFLSLYKFAPNTKVTFKQALPGALFATVGWQLSSLCFSYYVSINNYSLIYGNLGAIIILVGWFYLTALILILGGLINATLCKYKAYQ
ncbi:YihY/virulence factor BrkB family protein [Paenactinomyces guangxiensis]|uniref:YihY/virulence factor BrkB family protein n=1 Tax=Paenactinomyces guangxiensis TaxID=1490290 RepID=A0A7W1WPB9_9BACL|nr:YihY/virulence factor BrkB family protein [Paenactinomyces guangxiensis]MBA4493613.1 YihY/virulence factor BrkB family protein [Paenactinomyces guangxiensis]MBH8590900.1 YihY/virulence factor BrkB family protein [Paenactinomyces guangxiensis]